MNPIICSVEAERLNPPMKIADTQRAQSNLIQLDNDHHIRNDEDMTLARRELRSLQSDLKEQQLHNAEEEYQEKEKQLETAFLELQSLQVCVLMCCAMPVLHLHMYYYRKISMTTLITVYFCLS